MTDRSPWQSELEAYQEDLRAKAYRLVDYPPESIHDDEDLVEALLALIDGGNPT